MTRRFHRNCWPLTISAVVLVMAMAGCGSSKSSSSSSSSQASAQAKTTSSGGISGAAVSARGDQVLAKVHARKGSRPVPHLTGFDQSSVSNFIHSVDSDVGSFWQYQLTQAGYHYTPANELILAQSGPIHFVCDTRPWSVDTQNAAYCSADNTFYLPLNFLTKIYRDYGNAPLAYVIAHENGHHIQQLLGILAGYEAGALKSIQVELQADCFAGIWMSSVYGRGRVQPGDIEHAQGLLNDLGDPNGTLPTRRGAHGGPKQRLAAFMQGFNSGQGGNCQIPDLPTSES